MYSRAKFWKKKVFSFVWADIAKISAHTKVLWHMHNVSVHVSIPSRNFHATSLRKPFIYDMYVIKFNEKCTYQRFRISIHALICIYIHAFGWVHKGCIILWRLLPSKLLIIHIYVQLIKKGSKKRDSTKAFLN